MDKIIESAENLKRIGKQKPPRVPWGSYKGSIEQRAVAAAEMCEDHGWSRAQAAAAFCCNVTYVDLARGLSDEARRALAHNQLKLSRLRQERLAQRRSQRLAAEREAAVVAERAAQARVVDDVLASVGIDCLVDRIVTQFGPEPLLEELEVVLQRNGRDLGALVASVCGLDLSMAGLVRVSANGNGTHV